jgi:hypothetical protein
MRCWFAIGWPATRMVSVSTGGRKGNGNSSDPSISAHGRFVTFASTASNLAAGDTNRGSDVFVRDTVAHTTRLVSSASVAGRATVRAVCRR